MSSEPRLAHRVRIRLKSNPGLVWLPGINMSALIRDRIDEVKAIREWVDELVLLDKEQYEIDIHSSGTIMDIWFANEQHAALCALRWS